jgi:RHS repeat-associated protein
VLAMTDLVMGGWTYTYDDMNRLTSGTAASGVDVGLTLGWNYDRYGNRGPRRQVFVAGVINRWDQSVTGTGNATAVSPQLSFTGNNNRIDGWLYDAAGNMLYDQIHHYTYDAENRVATVDGQQAYIYDAEGIRVAKLGSGGAVTASYVLGLGGEQVSEVNGSGVWVHSNVFVGGRLMATYAGSGDTAKQGYHYHLTDWLGTQRMQTSASGNEEERCYSYPFGDGLSCTGADATEHHFTGKERDTESGLDYFGARYLSSSMGRFMSPDPKLFTKRHLANPQKWNKYAYVINNPLTRFDPDGLDDYVVFRPSAEFAGLHKSEWAAAEKAITGSKDSQGRQNTFHMIEGDKATLGAYNKALSTPDTHVVFVGHGTEDSHNNNAGTGVLLADGTSQGKNGGTIITAPSNDPTGFSFVFQGTPDVNVAASSVALFGCNTYDNASQYDGTDFTGVQSGANGTNIETVDMMGASWVAAGGGQAGDAAANNVLNNSQHPEDTGDNVESEQKKDPQ